METDAFLRSALAGTLNLEPSAVPENASLSDLGMDSLGMISVVAQLEVEYRMEISTDDILRMLQEDTFRGLLQRAEEVVGKRRTTTSEIGPGSVSHHTVVHVRKQCDQLFLIYRGGKMQLMMPAPFFVKRTRIHDRNILLFGDLGKSNYLDGISDDISRFSQFLNWQRKQIREAFPHATQLYGLGTSSGSLAAILSGHLLKVPVVFSFSLPLTRLSNGGKHYLDGIDGHGRPDTLCELLSEWNGVTEYRLYYNESCKQDREAAENLKECPGVKLFPQNGEGHLVLLTLANQGLLGEIFPPYSLIPS